MPLLATSSQLSFSSTSTTERKLVDIKTDNVNEKMEFFEVLISGPEVTNATGVKQVLSDKDKKRIIFGQNRARVFIRDGMWVIPSLASRVLLSFCYNAMCPF